uniref:DMPK_coil domain-containing protein n=1 Tax=Anopheles coluzzii TaxID=1518534 RepID=A0A6E8WAN4_ANOCL
MCTAKEALYLEHHLLRVDTMGRLVTTAGGKKSVPAKLQHQLTTIASSSPPPSTRTELVGHNELGVKNGHRSADLAGSIAARTRLQDALLLEEELKRSNRFCEQQNRLNKLKSTNGTDFDLCRNGPDYALVVQKPAAPTTAHLWSSLKVPKKLKGKLAAHLLKDKESNKENSINGDHNRLAGATATTKSAAAVATAGTVASSNHSPKPTLAKSTLLRSTSAVPTTATNHHATPPPPSHLSHHPQHAVNGSGGSGGVANNTTTASAASNATVKAIQRNGTIILDKSSSPLLICEVGERAKGVAAGANSATSTPEVQSILTILPSACSTPLVATAGTPVAAGKEPNCDQLHQQQHRNGRHRETAPHHSESKGSVDLAMLNHAQKGLDAFSCPTIKAAHQKTSADLLETKSILDEERTNSQTLKQQLLETTERETELQELHRCELSKVETCLSEQQRSADDRIAALEVQLLAKESHSRELLARIDGYEAKLADQAEQLESARARELDLLQRINALSCTENELRDKVHSSELAFSERLQAAAMRERDLTDQINGLHREMERMRRETERKERELEEKLTITKDECVVLRQSRNGSVEPACSQTGSGTAAASSGNMMNVSGNPLQLNRSSGNINHLQVLQDEVDSLRCVLDLKQREISELRKQTQEYERDAKDLPGALTKISALESRIEDLEVQLKTKTEEEKELQQKLKHLQDNLNQETKIKSRLSLHNEELQWRLKQNSEKFTLAYAELSKSYHENSSFMMNATKSSLDQSVSHHQHQLSHNQSRSSCSDRFFDMDDISPPTSPVIKGMVEKSDSVSWVLEIDDEPPEVSASRMVRRAGSFRSSAAYDSVAKRPKCAGLNQTTSGIQQSSSAASILKQHSSDLSAAAVKPPHSGAPSHRLRSKSVSIKAAEPPKKIVRSNSGASASPCPPAGVPCKPSLRMVDLPGSSWKEQPLYSSSPYAHKRYLTEELDLIGTGKPFAEQQQQHHNRAKDLFLEETEFLSEPDSPFARCPPNEAGEANMADPPVEIFHRDKTPHFKKSKENRGLITCDTTALMGGVGSSSKASGSGGALTAREKRREFTRNAGSALKEGAGEALVSGSNSDDEALSTSSSSSGSSSSCISEASLSSATGSSSSSHDNSPLHSGKRSSERMNNEHDDTVEGAANSSDEHPSQHRRRHSNVSLEDALMKKIVASLNGGGDEPHDGTPMEVSWSEDGDPGSESNV